MQKFPNSACRIFNATCSAEEVSQRHLGGWGEWELPPGAGTGLFVATAGLLLWAIAGGVLGGKFCCGLLKTWESCARTASWGTDGIGGVTLSFRGHAPEENDGGVGWGAGLWRGGLLTDFGGMGTCGFRSPYFISISCLCCPLPSVEQTVTRPSTPTKQFHSSDDNYGNYGNDDDNDHNSNNKNAHTRTHIHTHARLYLSYIWTWSSTMKNTSTMWNVCKEGIMN